VNFEWDDDKRLSNIEKHGFDFIGIEIVFGGETVTILDDRFDYGEKRFITFGLFDGRVVTIAHTETDTIIRIISVRKATTNEEINYFRELKT
jgi:uncharacterized DUF497 family protein